MSSYINVDLVIVGGGPAGMSAAVAAVACSSDVIITGAECASKSYPDFWTDIKNRLGMNVEFC